MLAELILHFNAMKAIRREIVSTKAMFEELKIILNIAKCIKGNQILSTKIAVLS